MKRRRDPLLVAGFLYLAVLIAFAVAWPSVRSRQIGRALQAPVDAVYNRISTSHQPPGTQVAAVDGAVLRSDPLGAVVTDSSPETSAAKAGILSGSTILRIDGQNAKGLPLGRIVELLSNRADCEVTVSTARLGQTATQTILWRRSQKPAAHPVASLPLGTDEQGRDIVARLAQGARISLFVGILVQVIALTAGVTVGVIGVFAPRWVANPLMRLTDGMFAFPDILLAILIIGVMGPGLLPVIVALAVTSWPSVSRLVKTQVATLKDREFVIAAKATGASTYYQVTRHILPQLWGILMAISMIEIAGTILAESTLSFLGIGVQAPDPSWGSMINNARVDMNSHPLLLLWPCIILSLTIFALNFVGDGIRAFLDPKRGD